MQYLAILILQNIHKSSDCTQYSDLTMTLDLRPVRNWPWQPNRCCASIKSFYCGRTTAAIGPMYTKLIFGVNINFVIVVSSTG